MFKISYRPAGFIFIAIALCLGLFIVFSPDTLSIPMPEFLNESIILASIGSGIVVLTTIPKLFKHVILWLTENGKRKEYIHIDTDTPIPDHMLQMAHEIENLGFAKLGAKGIMRDNGLLYRCWLWIDDAGEIIAYLTEHLPQPYAYFSTRFVDGFLVETAYNFQVEVNEKNLITHNLQSSINDAYHFHLHIFDEQRQIHHVARIFTDLASTDPRAEEHKKSMRDLYAGQITTLVTITLFWLTWTLAFALFAIFSLTTNAGVTLLAFCLVLGLSFSLINYKDVFTRLQPVNERKSRKAIEV